MTAGSLNTYSLASSDMPKVSNLYFGLLVFTGFVMTYLFSVPSTIPPLYYLCTLLGFMVLLSMGVLPLRYIIYPLIILMVNMADLTQSSEEIEVVGVISAATPWQFKLGPVTPAIFVFFILSVAFLRLFRIKKKSPYNIVFVYFLLVSVVISLWFGYPQEAVARFIADAKIPMFFCFGLIIFSSYFNRYPQNLMLVCQVFVALAIGNFIWDVLKLFFDTSEIVASVGYRNLSLDSGKGLMSLFTFFAIASLLDKKRVLLSLLVVLVTIYILIAYQTRWLLVTLALGFVMVGALLGAKRVLMLSVPLVIFFIFAIPIMIQLAPDVWRVMLLRFSFVGELGADASVMDVEVARVGSIYNSTKLLLDKNSLFTGMGYGSWYTDKYFPMPNLSISAFDTDSLDSGRYYRVHDFTFHFLFKFGIIGLFIYIGAFLKPLRKIWKIRKSVMVNREFRTVAIVLYGICPMVITYMWFTGKGLLFCALFIVVAYEWAKLFTRDAAGLRSDNTGEAGAGNG